jgi:hypothetical protein
MGAYPEPGPHDSLQATPPRAPGSTRRTTSIDITRPAGTPGRVVADVRGQDVATGPDGEARIGGRLAATLDLDERTGEVLAVATDAGGPLDGLAGLSLRAGYGRRLDAAFPDDAAARTLAYSALSDLGGAFLVSGYSLLRLGRLPATPELAERQARAQADVCIGWESGSPLLETLVRAGRSPIPYGPLAPVIDAADPLGWHPMAPLATGSVRRRRLLDVAAGNAGGAGGAGGAVLTAESHFRDSYAADDEDGEGEMVMHEYVVHAAVDDQRRLAKVAVEPRVLPWRECPGAVASAQRLVGVAVDDIPARARRELVGASTCTHLTSTLRCLADLGALAPAAFS